MIVVLTSSSAKVMLMYVKQHAINVYVNQRHKEENQIQSRARQLGYPSLDPVMSSAAFFSQYIDQICLGECCAKVLAGSLAAGCN